MNHGVRQLPCTQLGWRIRQHTLIDLHDADCQLLIAQARCEKQAISTQTPAGVNKVDIAGL